MSRGMVHAAQRGERVGRVLLVDDEPLFLRALERILRGAPLGLRSACSARDAERALAESEFDVVLLDQRLGAADGIELLTRMKRARPDLEVVIMTGHGSVASAVECMRRGAFDYLEKPFADPPRVREIIARAIERRAQRGCAAPGAIPALIGGSPETRALAAAVGSLRDNEASVLIQGEPGVGKEQLAAEIHAASPRRAGSFVPVDCAALSEATLERELFGPELGAASARAALAAARGGTLFLDDVSEVPPPVQAKLVRALGRGGGRAPGRPGGGDVDVRVIAASRVDLRALVDARRFRSDLYFRLAVVRLALPPLRERSVDIPQLARHFLAIHRRPNSGVIGFEPDALRALARRRWPGNARELEHAVEAALASAQGRLLQVGDFPPAANEASHDVSAPPRGVLPLSFDAYERSAIERALDETGGDATLAARRLGVGRSTLYRKLAKHGLVMRRAPPSGTAAPGPR